MKAEISMRVVWANPNFRSVLLRSQSEDTLNELYDKTKPYMWNEVLDRIEGEFEDFDEFEEFIYESSIDEIIERIGEDLFEDNEEDDEEDE